MLCKHIGPFTLFACQPLSSSFIAGTYLHSWLVLLCHLLFRHPCLSQMSPKACLSISKPRLGWISLQTVVLPETVFFLPLGCPFSKLDAPKQIDQESSILSKRLLGSMSFIFSSLLETLLRALFAFQLLPNIVQMVLMSHHCRSFIF